jgi:phosphoribosylaminoimidazole-succinocarboxamide synthase
MFKKHQQRDFMQKLEELYRGKAKSVYNTDDAEHFIMEFRNDTSAFDGKKLAQLDRKGMVNNKFNAFIMEKLAAAGIPTHFVKLLSDTESVVKRLTMLPLECVVRNVAAGSICRRYGIKEGTELTPPTFEFFLKSDALGDPMVNESHIHSFGWATDEQVAAMKDLTLQCNVVLKKLFADAGMILVDYKLEFGLFNGKMVLADEFSPDGCRIWDAQTREKMDKDRFRQDLGNVIEFYETVGRRLGVAL